MVDEALNQATKNLREGRLQQALKDHQSLVEIDPRNAVAFEGLGRTLYQLGRYDEAITAYRKALELEPSLAIPHADLGNIYYLRRQFPQSEKEYRQAIEIDPKLHAPYMNLGFILAMKGELGESETMLKKAIELEPENVLSYCTLIEVYLRQKRFSDAKGIARRAFKLSPTISTAFQIIWAIVRAYPQQIVYAILLLLFFIALKVQPAIGLMIGLGLAIRGVLESIASFQSGARKQAVITGVLTFLLLGIAILVYWTSLKR